MAACQLLHQLGFLDRHGAEDDAIEAAGQQLFGALCAAHAAAQLHRNGEGCGDRLHGLIVDRLAGFGAIEIHQVEPLGALTLPLEGLGHRVVVETGHLVVVALVQAHAVAVEQVDGGDDLHGGRSAQRLPARLPEAPILQLAQGHQQPALAIEHCFQAGCPVSSFALLPQQLEVAVALGEAEAGGLGRPALGQLHGSWAASPYVS